MRVSESLLFTNSLIDAQKSRAKVLVAQKQLSSGVRVRSPSEDTASYLKSKRLDIFLENVKSYEENAGRAKSFMQSTDSTLGEITNLLSRTRELAVQMANGVPTASDRQMAAQEIGTIRQECIKLANSKMGNEYLFSGNLKSSPAYDSAGTYLGDTNHRDIEIGDGLTVTLNVTGEETFSPAGGVNVFSILQDLETALNTNDITGITNSLSGIDQSIEQISDSRSKLGERLNTITLSENVNARFKENVNAEKSRLIDTDVIDASSNLALSTHGMEASFAAISKVVNVSLLDRL